MRDGSVRIARHVIPPCCPGLVVVAREAREFGGGVHKCPGVQLGRLMGQVAVELLSRRLPVAQPPAVRPSVVLEARRLQTRPDVEPVDLELRAGEILGLAGLAGHGHEDFLRSLCGLRRPWAGEVDAVEGGARRPLRGLASAARSGIVYLPRDRAAQGVFPQLSVIDNFAMMAMRRWARLGVVRRRRVARAYDDLAGRLSIVAASPRAPIATLSGGNQQKVLLARLMVMRPRAMLLDDPTRGVDVATRGALHRTLGALARGRMTALALLSTEIEELVALCDRVLVFHRGSVVAELSEPDLSAPRLIAAMFGRAPDG